MSTILITAGGTGGHVLPGLAVARRLHHSGIQVVWMGTRRGLEAKLVPPTGIHMEWIAIQGLRGRGLLGWLLLPFRALYAMTQAAIILLRRRPAAVLCMGGFVSGPGGLMAWVLRRPLVIHEQNAVPGFTNRILSLFATRVLVGFPETFRHIPGVQHVGNPVRPEISAIAAPEDRMGDRRGPLRVLLLGGSQGARALNRVLAQTYSKLAGENLVEIWHQSGERWLDETRAAYGAHADQVRLSPFIDDMAAAYEWADIVICRAGAMTVAELTAAGVGAILVPFPHATDDHQTANARFLASRDAAVLLPELECTPTRLAEVLRDLASERAAVLQMAQHARECSTPDADETIARICEEVRRA
ncbi:MAG: undecaprenyldiphospho-muramoylpentapeptide beta-N-acetylglucosaminyltransferase [Acidiferrobacteraceae bacterium]|jgi:UDP-N-acetylglucosamine--N-acetylmuramyl-(pentapeptide) pyrophosphoryl-undecaprenol N-acetylglucosamine transferase